MDATFSFSYTWFHECLALLIGCGEDIIKTWFRSTLWTYLLIKLALVNTITWLSKWTCLLVSTLIRTWNGIGNATSSIRFASWQELLAFNISSGCCIVLTDFVYASLNCFKTRPARLSIIDCLDCVTLLACPIKFAASILFLNTCSLW